MTSLHDRQAALVAALVAGAEIPAGFDSTRVRATRRALLRKRAGEVAHAWPLLAAAHGARWTETFTTWAAGRAPKGSLRDGWDLARDLVAGPGLPAPAAEELAAREVAWRYDGRAQPRRRRLPALRRAPGAVLVQFLGTVRVLRG
jgi:hypothetical protein